MTKDKGPIIYYAHPMSWYGTQRERDDLAVLSKEGTVANPNSNKFDVKVEYAKATGMPIMDVFATFIRDKADVLVFRRFSGDHRIGAGVAREILEARIWGKQIWEIIGGRVQPPVINKFVMDPAQFDIGTSFRIEDVLTVAETRERIARKQL